MTNTEKAAQGAAPPPVGLGNPGTTTAQASGFITAETGQTSRITTTDSGQSRTTALAGEPRRTRQRSLIWDFLGRTAQFKTAWQIHDELRDSGTPVSLPTVYRTLAAMAEAGELDQLTRDGQSSFRRCSPQHHHHLFCRGCGRTIELTEAPVEQWAAEIAQRYGFAEIDHITEISGLCPDCQNR